MGEGRDTATGRLRDLPAVHELAARLNGPHALTVVAARRAIDEERAAVRGGTNQDVAEVERRARFHLKALEQPSLRRVINATGVVVHTNLGRAPLGAAARRALTHAAEGYSNLELDLPAGTRGSRQDHVQDVLRDLTGAEAALAVNNGAAAVLLAVATLGGAGRGVIVSRGQLVEIGGGFRIPEVVAHSGARLIEVGTTNRTRLADYRRVIDRADADAAAILRVHQSNFRSVGFVEDTPIRDLCRLGLPVIDDVGSGVLGHADIVPVLAEEPSIADSVSAGAAIVCCSGDKLLGGPQAGIMVGTAEAIGAAREHPLARAMRIDKLSLAALEATVSLYREPDRALTEIPVLAMLTARPEVLADRASRLSAAIGAGAEVIACMGKVGGGALPLMELPGYAVALPGDAASLATSLRSGDPPVICRINSGRALLDMRTVADEELESLASAIRSALS